MGQARQGALARVVLSGLRRLVLVRPAGRLLALDVLHYHIRPAAAWEAEVPAGAVPPEELQLALQLIEAARGPLDWARYPDTTAAELAALIQAKLANQPPAADDEPAFLQLVDALKQSVAAVRGPESPRGAALQPGPGRARRRASP